MKLKSVMQLMLGLVFMLWACKDEKTFQGKHDPDVIKTYHNNSTPASRMDSLSSVNFITKQKLTEVYELASLYSTNQGDSLMLEILYPQIKSYFLENDSLILKNFINEMDSLKVHYVEIRGLNLSEKDSLIPDSVRSVDYSVYYYSKNKKLIDSLPKSANYILKKEPKKFKNEFIFYFTGLNSAHEVKDTISSDVTQ